MNKRSVDRDLDVYRNLLSKLAQGKELIKEYVERWVETAFSCEIRQFS